MDRFRDVIDLWPSRVAFASDVCISPIAASAWWQRDSIPADRWNAVVAAAQRRGSVDVTHKLLSDLAERRRRQSATPPSAAPLACPAS